MQYEAVIEKIPFSFVEDNTFTEIIEASNYEEAIDIAFGKHKRHLTSVWDIEGQYCVYCGDENDYLP